MLLALLADVFLIARMDLGFYLNVYLYFLVLIHLPVVTEKHFALLVAFIIGISVDQSLHTGGLHAAASLTAMYFRPVFIKAFGPREGREKADYLTIYNFGVANYILYLFFMTLIHQSCLVVLESFSVVSFPVMVMRILAGLGASLLLYIALHLLTVRRSVAS
ncbi:MAG: hypothetical protein NZM65_07755 [Flavobacteriales bacterium]|nr:hypothetical protein [Flavobacteriales bacterium]MDW8410566.1 hypothetical protein [Flavobacteriales bacterium]